MHYYSGDTRQITEGERVRYISGSSFRVPIAFASPAYLVRASLAAALSLFISASL